MSQTHEKTIADMFDRIASRYDFLNSLLSMRQDRRWRHKLISWLPPVNEGRLLDVACGTGDILKTAFLNRKDYVNFVGVDISKEMLKLAEKKLNDLGLKNSNQTSLTLNAMSAEKLEFPDQSFDAVTISFGLRNVGDKERALEEFKRVLKPGGKLFVLEFFQSKSGILSHLFRFYFHFILPLIGALFSDKKAYTYLPKSVDSFYEIQEFSKILEKKGFLKSRQKIFLWGACVLVEASKH